MSLNRPEAQRSRSKGGDSVARALQRDHRETDPRGRAGGRGGRGPGGGGAARKGAVVGTACVVGRLTHGAHGTLLPVATAALV